MRLAVVSRPSTRLSLAGPRLASVLGLSRVCLAVVVGRWVPVAGSRLSPTELGFGNWNWTKLQGCRGLLGEIVRPNAPRLQWLLASMVGLGIHSLTGLGWAGKLLCAHGKLDNPDPTRKFKILCHVSCLPSGRPGRRPASTSIGQLGPALQTMEQKSWNNPSLLSPPTLHRGQRRRFGATPAPTLR